MNLILGSEIHNGIEYRAIRYFKNNYGIENDYEQLNMFSCNHKGLLKLIIEDMEKEDVK